MSRLTHMAFVAEPVLDPLDPESPEPSPPDDPSTDSAAPTASEDYNLPFESNTQLTLPSPQI